MKTVEALGMAALWLAAVGPGCGNSETGGSAAMIPGATAAPAPGVSAPATAGAAVSVPSAGQPGAASAAAGSSATPSAGKSAPTAPTPAAGGGSSAAPSGMAGSSAAPSGMAGSGAGGMVAASGGSPGSAGSDAAGMPGTQPPVDAPAPMSAPLVWGFGLGITDVPAAVKFYTDVMKMTVEKDAIKNGDRTETVLYAKQAMRGARLSLMKFDDMRNTRKITTKVVWQAANASAVNSAAAMYPDYQSRLNIGIVQFDGPETYVHEVGSIFDTGGGSITVPYLIACGFAVSDQPAARKFYTSLGMTESNIGSFSVTDANGTGSIQEYSVKFADGMGIVLQQWTPMRNAKDNPVKVTMLVPKAQEMADKVMAAGGTIVKPAERTPLYDNRLLIVAKDLDGYVLDIVE